MRRQRLILVGAVAFGLLFWLIDAALDAVWFYQRTFWELLIGAVPGHEIYIRLAALGCFVIFGLFMSAALAAGSAAQALALAAGQRGPIQLLVTDVVMPGMNGRQLAETLAAQRPDLKTLYVSGYTSNVIGEHGVLDEGVDFLAKPFSSAALLRRGREVLDQPLDVPVADTAFKSRGPRG